MKGCPEQKTSDIEVDPGSQMVNFRGFHATVGAIGQVLIVCINVMVADRWTARQVIAIHGLVSRCRVGQHRLTSHWLKRVIILLIGDET